MSDGIGLAEALFGLDGFRVLAVQENAAELVVTVESTADRAACSGCGVRAEAQDRLRVELRDLPCFGRPARLVWLKRRWRCREELCPVKTWTEQVAAVLARSVMTVRAGLEATRQVGQLARPVAEVAREFGVCWWTVMNAIIQHGKPLVDEPDRVGVTRALGVDETTFQSANREHTTLYATGLVDLDRRVMIDMVEGNGAADLRRWTQNQDQKWLEGVEVVATDLAESYRSGLSPSLDHALRVADPFHVVRVRHEAPCLRGQARDPPRRAVAADR